MTRPSPLQRVRADFGTKAKLAQQVLEFLPTPEGEERARFEARIKRMPNSKLLRLFDAQKAMTRRFKTREALIERIVKAKFTNGNAPYQAKVSKMTVPRLLDLARQLNA